MVTFDLSRSREKLTTHSGLALIGMALKHTELDKRINKIQLPKIKGSPDISHSDIIRSYVGLLCQGKHAFEAVEDFRGEEPFFDLALDIKQVPSCSTLRQRFNQLGEIEQSDSFPTDISLPYTF